MFLYSVNCRASSDTPALWRPAADLAARFPHPTSDPPSHRPADAPPPPTPSRQHGRRLRTRGPHTATRNPHHDRLTDTHPVAATPRPPSQRRWAPCRRPAVHRRRRQIYYFFVKTKMSGFFQVLFYFSYMAIFCVALGTMCGTLGYGGCAAFVRRIYANARVA